MSLRRDVRTFTNVIALILCGGLAGVIVAAAALPAVGITGLTAKSATDSFQNLPSELESPPLPQTSWLYAADGTVITSFFDENREITQLKDVPMVMRHAMVAAEDSRFYQHRGVDVKGVLRAFVVNQTKGTVTQGASTLTQQYVKNVLKYRAKNERERRAAEAPTPARKLREMRYAMELEKKFKKDEILDRYLNIAFFGNRGYGIGGAAKVYFSKPVSKLTLAESAMLAGMVKSPTQYNPMAGPKSKIKAQDRRNYILDQMAELNYVSQKEADEAKKQPIVLKPNRTPGTCNAARPEFGFYCDWFVTWWKTRPEFGKTASQRFDNLRKGGYRIYSALDTRMQAGAQRAVDKHLGKSSEVATGTVLVQPGTGQVKAMAINRIFGHGKNVGKNRPFTENPLLTGSTNSPGYQAGSTFKMFTMVAALQQNIPLNMTIDSPPQYQSNYRSTEPPSCNGYYCPKNASSGMTGVHTMYSGFGESVNTFFVQLEEMVGVKAAVVAAEKLGVVFRQKMATSGGGPIDQGEWFKQTGSPSFTLGTALVTPLDMATAYATIAAHGKHCDPTPVSRVLDRDGKLVKAASAPRCNQAIPADIADAAADAARCPVGDGSGGKCSRHNGVTAGSVGRGIDRPIAGKSGSTDSNHSVWFAGFTPNLASAVFVANPDNSKQSVSNYHDVPAAVFVSSMNTALAGMPVLNFTRPTALRIYGVQVHMPSVDGLDPNDAKYQLQALGFRVKVNTEQVPSKYPAGKVAKTSPDGGGYASKGSVIVIFISNGKPEPGQPGIPPIPGRPPGFPTPRFPR